MGGGGGGDDTMAMWWRCHPTTINQYYIIIMSSPAPTHSLPTPPLLTHLARTLTSTTPNLHRVIINAASHHPLPTSPHSLNQSLTYALISNTLDSRQVAPSPSSHHHRVIAITTTTTHALTHSHAHLPRTLTSITTTSSSWHRHYPPTRPPFPSN